MKTTALASLLAALACVRPPGGSEGRPDEVTPLRAAGVEFRVEYAPDDAPAARQVFAALQQSAQLAARWGRLTVPVTITIHGSHEGLEAAARRSGYPWMRAWARYASIDLQSPRTWSHGFATDEQLVEILAHELTHCVLYQATKDPAAFGRRGIPLWFREGMASVTAGEHHAARAPVVPAAGGAARVGLSMLAYGRGAAGADGMYDQAQHAFELLLQRHGDESVRAILSLLGQGETFGAAFRQAVGLSLEEFEAEVVKA